MKKIISVLMLSIILIFTIADVNAAQNKQINGYEIWCSGKTVYAINAQNELYAWGENKGQIPNSDESIVTTPTKVLDNVIDSQHMITKTPHSTSEIAAITTNGDLYTWGSDSYGELGQGGDDSISNSRTLPINKILDNVIDVACEEFSYAMAAVKSNGDLYTWGRNTIGSFSGLLGTGEGDDVYTRATPRKIFENVREIEAGDGFFAVITNDDILYTWGQRGAIGDGNYQHTNTPTQIMGDVKNVFISGQTIAAITNNNDLYLWGAPLDNKSSHDENEYIKTPQKLLSNVKQFEISRKIMIAITKNNELYISGKNESGLLGESVGDYTNAFIKIMDDVIDYSFGEDFIAVITKNNELFTWGNEAGGALGNGHVPYIKASQASSFVATPKKIMDNVKYVSCGYGHAIAITDNDELYIWGYNEQGELGNGTNKDNGTPTKLLDNVLYAKCIGENTFIIDSSNQLLICGDNRYGQLGNGTTDSSSKLVNSLKNLKPTDNEATNILNTISTNTPTIITSFGSTVSNWAAPEIELAFQHGLIPETMIGFDLTQRVNRGEFAAIAVELYDTIANTATGLPKDCPFVDINGDVNKQAIMKAFGLQVTDGTSKTTFEPLNDITREQLATMLCRVIKKYKDPNWNLANDADYYLDTSGTVKFEDDVDISEWAKPSVYFMSKFEIIRGIDDTHFAPKNTTSLQEAKGYAFATREQAIILSERIFKISDMWK